MKMAKASEQDIDAAGEAMSVLNQIVDPTADVLELHPRFSAQAEQLTNLLAIAEETLASFAVTFRDQGLRARLQAAVDAAKGVS